MRAVSLNYDIEFLLRQRPLIELSLFTIKDGKDSIVIGALSHIYIAFQIPH
jgi:hypothetical protein